MKIKKFRDWHDDTKVLLIRMWVAGAVCFFVTWGTKLALESGIIFVAVLVLAMVVVEWIIVNPVARLMFNTRDFIDKDISRWRNFGYRMLNLLKIAVIMLIIVLFYNVMNLFLIWAMKLANDAVPLPLEPILFGLIYGICYFIASKLKYLSLKILRKIKNKNIDEEN